MANIVANVANLMSEATAPRMGKLVTSARVLIISKLFVVPRLQQPRWDRALSLKQEATAAAETWFHWGATAEVRAKEVATVNTRRRRTPKKPPKQKAYAGDVQKLQSHQKQQLHLVAEREKQGNVSSKTRSFQDQGTGGRRYVQQVFLLCSSQ